MHDGMAVIRVLCRVAGPAGNFPPGAILSVPVAEAETLVAPGYAEYIEKPEAEMPKQPEKQPAKQPAKKAVKK